MDGFWIGLGVAIAGFCIGQGLDSLGQDISKTIQNITNLTKAAMALANLERKQ